MKRKRDRDPELIESLKQSITLDPVNWNYLCFTHPFIKNNKYLAMVAIQATDQPRSIVQTLSQDLRRDQDIITSAIQRDGLALKYADETLRNNKEIVLLAIQNDGWAIKYASLDLQLDKELVRVAILDTPNTLSFIDVRFTMDKDFIMDIIKIAPISYKYIGPLKFDKDVALLALKDKRIKVDIPKDLLIYREIALIMANRWDIQHERIKGDIKFIYA